jgi:hypothetical protein
MWSTWVHSRFRWSSCCGSLVFCVAFCSSLFVCPFWPLFVCPFWSLQCLTFLDLRLLITLWYLQIVLDRKGQFYIIELVYLIARYYIFIKVLYHNGLINRDILYFKPEFNMLMMKCIYLCRTENSFNLYNPVLYSISCSLMCLYFERI